MKIIGIDPSINSTGICVREFNMDNTKENIKYYLIQPDTYMSKKMIKTLDELLMSNLIIERLTYSKLTPSKTDNYSTKECKKSHNISSVASIIKTIIEKEKPDKVNMEGISYGSVGSAAIGDLAGLNHTIRYVLSNYSIIAPTELKKHSTGNGSADKSEMIYCWFNCHKEMEIFKEFKVDDLADAYFLTFI